MAVVVGFFKLKKVCVCVCVGGGGVDKGLYVL